MNSSCVNKSNAFIQIFKKVYQDCSPGFSILKKFCFQAIFSDFSHLCNISNDILINDYKNSTVH